MSSSGAPKFNEYFKGKPEVTVFAKSLGGKPISVFSAPTGTDKIGVLKDGDPITVFPGASYQPRYNIRFGRVHRGYLADQNVGKPPKAGAKVKDEKPNPELNRITANDFTKLGNRTSFMFGPDMVDCREFTSPSKLISSIRSGMSIVRGVSKPVEETFDTFFNNPTLSGFKWHPDVTDKEKGKFGTYFGELLVGLYALSNRRNHFNMVPWKGTPARFLMPSDSSFSGVDSFLEMDTGEIVPISSKYGIGAPASFFSNLLIKGMKHHDKLPKSIFKELVETAISIGVTPQMLNAKKGAKEIMYEYGVRRLLEIKKLEVEKPFRVYDSIRTNKPDDDSNLVVTKISNHDKVEPRVKAELGKSTSSFFCRETARLLGEDKASMDIMRGILVGKNFWQANLSKPNWENKGTVHFNLVNSGVARLEVVGNKSSIPDITSGNGTVSYFLKVR